MTKEAYQQERDAKRSAKVVNRMRRNLALIAQGRAPIGQPPPDEATRVGALVALGVKPLHVPGAVHKCGDREYVVAGDGSWRRKRERGKR